MKTMTKYVLGFMFNSQFEQVALIIKQRPDWQKGKLNGIGGHVEDGETSIEAVIREFKEETDLQTEPTQWIHYCTMDGREQDCFSVDCFASVGDLNKLKTITDEEIFIQVVKNINFANCIENLPWLINLAIDTLMDGRPYFTTVQYK